eukprot:gene8002-14607_t
MPGYYGDGKHGGQQPQYGDQQPQCGDQQPQYENTGGQYQNNDGGQYQNNDGGRNQDYSGNGNNGDDYGNGNQNNGGQNQINSGYGYNGHDPCGDQQYGGQPPLHGVQQQQYGDQQQQYNYYFYDGDIANDLGGSAKWYPADNGTEGDLLSNAGSNSETLIEVTPGDALEIQQGLPSIVQLQVRIAGPSVDGSGDFIGSGDIIGDDYDAAAAGDGTTPLAFIEDGSMPWPGLSNASFDYRDGPNSPTAVQLVWEGVFLGDVGETGVVGGRVKFEADPFACYSDIAVPFVTVAAEEPLLVNEITLDADLDTFAPTDQVEYFSNLAALLQSRLSFAIDKSNFVVSSMVNGSVVIAMGVAGLDNCDQYAELKTLLLSLSLQTAAEKVIVDKNLGNVRTTFGPAVKLVGVCATTSTTTSTTTTTTSSTSIVLAVDPSALSQKAKDGLVAAGSIIFLLGLLFLAVWCIGASEEKKEAAAGETFEMMENPMYALRNGRNLNRAAAAPAQQQPTQEQTSNGQASGSSSGTASAPAPAPPPPPSSNDSPYASPLVTAETWPIGADGSPSSSPLVAAPVDVLQSTSSNGTTVGQAGSSGTAASLSLGGIAYASSDGADNIGDYAASEEVQHGTGASAAGATTGTAASLSLGGVAYAINEAVYVPQESMPSEPLLSYEVLQTGGTTLAPVRSPISPLAVNEANEVRMVQPGGMNKDRPPLLPKKKGKANRKAGAANSAAAASSEADAQFSAGAPAELGGIPYGEGQELMRPPLHPKKKGKAKSKAEAANSAAAASSEADAQFSAGAPAELGGIPYGEGQELMQPGGMKTERPPLHPKKKGKAKSKAGAANSAAAASIAGMAPQDTLPKFTPPEADAQFSTSAPSELGGIPYQVWSAPGAAANDEGASTAPATAAPAEHAVPVEAEAAASPDGMPRLISTESLKRAEAVAALDPNYSGYAPPIEAEAGARRAGRRSYVNIEPSADTLLPAATPVLDAAVYAVPIEAEAGARRAGRRSYVNIEPSADTLLPAATPVLVFTTVTQC